MIRSLPLALSALVVTGALLVGCTPSSPAATTPSPSSSASSAPSSEPEPEPTPTAVAVDATCENTVAPDVLDAFADYNWTAGNIQDPWVVVEGYEAGISCVWGDYSIASDNVSWLAWAPLPDAEAEEVIAALLAQGGWTRSDTAEGVQVTADASQAIHVDNEGYATTYLFGDGQVKAATTRADLAAIVAPPGFSS